MTNDFPQDAASDEPARNGANDDPFTRLEKEMTAMKSASLSYGCGTGRAFWLASQR